MRELLRVWLWVTIGVWLLLVPLCAGALVLGQMRPEQHQIAFVVSEGNYSNIYLLDVDTGFEVRLTNNPGDRYYGELDWSPDGSMLAFYVSANGEEAIYVMNAYGRNQRRVTADFHIGLPEARMQWMWSPDSTRIAYSSIEFGERHLSGSSDLFIVDVRTGDIVSLSDECRCDHLRTWTPDGSQFLFSSSRRTAEEQLLITPRLFLADADGSNMHLFEQEYGGLILDAPEPYAWSPDMHWAAVNFGRYSTGTLSIVDIEANTLYDTGLQVQDWPVWSPDGNDLLLATWNGDEGIEPRDLYIVGADGTEQQLLLGDVLHYSLYAAWSPDGSRIAFVSEHEGNPEIYVIDVDGNNPRNLSNNPAYDGSPRWSPDGQWVLYASNRDKVPSERDWEYFVVNVETGESRQVTSEHRIEYDLSWRPVPAS